MLRFDPNLRWLFTELPMIERYAAAAAAGFEGVEVAFPYEFPAREVAARLSDNGLELVQILTPCDWAAGERGIAAVAGREAEFRASVGIAIEYAVQVGKPLIHAMAGNLEPGVDRRKAQATFLENIAFAADQAAAEGLTIILEPCCTDRFPDYFYHRLDEGIAVIKELGRDNVKLCFDTLHVQSEEGSLTQRLRSAFLISGTSRSVTSRAGMNQVLAKSAFHSCSTRSRSWVGRAGSVVNFRHLRRAPTNALIGAGLTGSVPPLVDRRLSAAGLCAEFSLL